MRIDWGIIALLLLFILGILAQSSHASSLIASIPPSVGWSINTIKEETDYNNDGIPDVEVDIARMNETYLEIYVNDTRETGAYKWSSAICNISNVPQVGKWEYNHKTEVWSYTGLLQYGKLSDYGMNTSWCNETGNYGFVLFGAGSGDKQYRLNFTEGKKNITIYTGKGSSIITATLTDTQPWLASTRTICRTTNAIHVVAINGTQVDYWNSTDGVTWSAMYRLDGSSSGDDALVAGTVTIACSGTRVFVAWMCDDSRGDVHYRNSSDEGKTWNALVGGTEATILIDGTGSSADGIQMGNCMFGYNYNIWCAYHWDGGTVEDIRVVNTTGYGGATPTVTNKAMGVDISATASSPTLFVNMSGTTEEVYVVWRNYDDTGMYSNNTVNSGTTWSGKKIRTSASTYPPSLVVMNKTIFVTEGTNLWNSTDSGATWGAQYSVLGSVYPVLSTDNYTNLWNFYDNVTNGIDTYYKQWNISSGWSSVIDWQDLNSPAIYSLPNCNWYNASNLIECVFINRTAESGNIDLRYDFINLTAGVPPTYISAYDSCTYGEQTTKKIQLKRKAYDSATYGEQLVRKIQLIRSMYDSATYGEQVTKWGLLHISAYDSATYGELTKKVNTLVRSVYDSVTYGEDIAELKQLIRYAYDSATYGELTSKKFALSIFLYDSTTYGEQLAEWELRHISLQDSATYGEYTTRIKGMVRNFYDSATFGEEVARKIQLKRNAYDSVTYGEQIIKLGLWRISTYDSATYGELVDELHSLHVQLSDSAVYGEQVTKWGLLHISAYDSATYGELISVILPGGVTTIKTLYDSVTYGEQLYKSVTFIRGFYDSVTYGESLNQFRRIIRNVYDSAAVSDLINVVQTIINVILNQVTITFPCNATSTQGDFTNVSFFITSNGTWQRNETQNITGTTNATNFTKTLLLGKYQWNCEWCTEDHCMYAFPNQSLLVNFTEPLGMVFLESIDVVSIVVVLAFAALTLTFMYIGINIKEESKGIKLLFFVLSLVFLSASLMAVSSVINTASPSNLVTVDYNQTSSVMTYNYNQTSNYSSVANIFTNMANPVHWVIYLIIALVLVSIVFYLAEAAFGRKAGI